MDVKCLSFSITVPNLCSMFNWKESFTLLRLLYCVLPCFTMSLYVLQCLTMSYYVLLCPTHILLCLTMSHFVSLCLTMSYLCLTTPHYILLCPTHVLLRLTMSYYVVLMSYFAPSLIWSFSYGTITIFTDKSQTKFPTFWFSPLKCPF